MTSLACLAYGVSCPASSNPLTTLFNCQVFRNFNQCNNNSGGATCTSIPGGGTQGIATVYSCPVTCLLGYSLNNGVCVLSCSGQICINLINPILNPAFQNAVPVCNAAGACDYNCPANSIKGCLGVAGCYSTCNAASQVPARRRQLASANRRREIEEQVTLALKSGPSPVDGKWGSVLCPGKQIACSIPGSGDRQWECIDSSTDYNSCGGCVGGRGQGTDCEAATGTEHSICKKGQCEAVHCSPGFIRESMLVANNTRAITCVPSKRTLSAASGVKLLHHTGSLNDLL